jgi:hypothetical protein
MALNFPALGGQLPPATNTSDKGASSDPVVAKLTAKYGSIPNYTPPENVSTPVAPAPTPEKGFFKSLVSAPATMLARPIQAAQAVGDYIGTKMEESGTPEQIQAVQNAAYERDKAKQTDTGSVIAPTPANYSDVKKDVGRGIQTVALGMGPVSGGAAFGTGMSMEQGHDFLSAQTAIDAALGAAGGKLLSLVGKPVFNAAGKVIGKVTPEFIQNLAGKGAKAIEEFAAQHDILPEFASNAINTGAEKIEGAMNKPFDLAGEIAMKPVNAVKGKISAMKQEAIPGAIDDLEQNLKDISQGYKSTIKARNRNEDFTLAKNAAGTEGKTGIRIAAEMGIVPEYEGTKFATHNQAKIIREQIAPLKGALDEGLKEVEMSAPAPKTIDIATRFKDLVDKNIKTEAQRKMMLSEGIKELQGLGAETPITKLNTEKSGHWDLTTFDSGEKTVRQYHYMMAKAMQEEIESTAEKAGFKEMAQLNRDIGDRLEAAKFVESLNGNTVLNGKLGKHLMRMSGMIMGARNGPLQAAFGLAGGEVASRMLTNYSIASPMNRYLLRDLEMRDPESYKAVMEWIKQQGVDREGRLLLGQGPTILGAEKTKSTPANVFGNDITQNSQILNNTKALPAPTEKIITPNTQGTPNQPGVPYSPNNVPDVGGMRQRTTNQAEPQ